MASQMQLGGRTALITGAAGGIGRGIALALARRGCHLILGDIDEPGLARTLEMLRTSGIRAGGYRLDIGDVEDVATFPERLGAEYPGLDLLINNAGVAVGGMFEQVSEADFAWLFNINFWGAVRMTRAFLPRLRQSDDARIVNISSVFGLVAPPGQTAYAASKFAIRGFSESLRHELYGTQIGVTVVHPGGVNTSIAVKARQPAGVSPEEVERQRAEFQKLLRMPPEVAGETIVKGIERRKDRILVGTDARLIDTIQRLRPASYWKLFARLLRR